ncbi:hypothetical protein EC988_002194 [Linderina pennispora]|nr:hypothetical protein EC988_002194 [Linderina pennispora]
MVSNNTGGVFNKLRRTVTSKSSTVNPRTLSKSATSPTLKPLSLKRSPTLSPRMQPATVSPEPQSRSILRSNTLPVRKAEPEAPMALPKEPLTPPLEPTDDGGTDVQWTLLKCKGMVNLHVVTVPTSISSLNHKDAFLLYPCLFRKLSQTALTSMVSFPLADEEGHTSLAKSRRNSQRNAEPLLAQEYNRRKSICAMASRVIYVWIGAHAAAIKRDAITRVAMEIRDRELLGKAAVVIIDESTASDSARHKFFTRLNSVNSRGMGPVAVPSLYSQITPTSRAGDDTDFERALERRKVLYGFWEAVPPATILSVGSDVQAATLLKVPMGGVVVLDTWADVFIWWRNEPCNPAVRKCAVNFANMLVQDTCIPPRPKSASVWHEVRGFEHVIFKTKFPDWPFVFAASMAPVRNQRQMIGGSVMPPAAVPIRSVSRSSQAVAVA